MNLPPIIARLIGVKPTQSMHLSNTVRSEPQIAAPQPLPQEPPMNFIAILKAAALALRLLPIVSAFVQEAEASLVNATGSQKLAAVTASVNKYLSELNADAATIQALQTQLGPMIEGAVAMFNTSGVFKTQPLIAEASPPPTPPPPAASN